MKSRQFGNHLMKWIILSFSWIYILEVQFVYRLSAGMDDTMFVKQYTATFVYMNLEQQWAAAVLFQMESCTKVSSNDHIRESWIRPGID